MLRIPPDQTKDGAVQRRCHSVQMHTNEDSRRYLLSSLHTSREQLTIVFVICSYAKACTFWLCEVYVTCIFLFLIVGDVVVVDHFVVTCLPFIVMSFLWCLHLCDSCHKEIFQKDNKQN